MVENDILTEFREVGTEKKKKKVIKRWSQAESFSIFENHVYMSKKNLLFAQKFVAIF